MSPEQAPPRRNSTAGAISTHWPACSTKCWPGTRPSRAQTQATLSRHLVATPAPLRARRPIVPEPVERAVLRALAKSPDNRFGTTAEFAAALHRSGRYPRRAPGAPSGRRRASLRERESRSRNEYLSDGITDELINALANVAGLRVASRTSVFALKGRKEDVRDAGT